MTPAVLLAPLTRLQDAFAALTAATDPSAVVPGLVSWHVRGLALHLASVHRWAAGIVVDGGATALDAALAAGVTP